MINRRMGKMLLTKLSPDEGEEALYSLTFRQARALLDLTEYLRWPTRHQDIPSELSTLPNLEKWVSGLELRLMKEVSPSMVDCDFIEDCIDTALDNPESPLYQKIRDKIAADKDFLDKVSKGLVPFTEGQINTGDESLNELWSQCTQIVEFTNTRILALLADLEVQSNNGEILSFSEALPFIGTLIDETQVDVALNFVQYSQEIWNEQYNANYTEDPPPSLGTKWRLACALFCACKTDKVISIDRIIGAFSSLVSGIDLSLDSIGEIIQTLIGINDDNEQVVFVSFAAVWGIAKLVSWLGNSKVSERILSSLLKLATNDANDDWIVYCEDCAPAPTWEKFFLPFEPGDTNKGTVSDDGAGTVVFTAGFSYGAYRIGWSYKIEGVQYCFRILSLEGYDGVEFPHSGTCEAVETDTPPVEGGCYQIMVAARMTPFTVTVIYEACGI